MTWARTHLVLGDPPAGDRRVSTIQERGAITEVEGSQVTRPAGHLGFFFEPRGVH